MAKKWLIYVQHCCINLDVYSFINEYHTKYCVCYFAHSCVPMQHRGQNVVLMCLIAQLLEHLLEVSGVLGSNPNGDHLSFLSSNVEFFVVELVFLFFKF